MENNTLTNLFNDLRHDFDVEEPQGGHKQRFLEKLSSQQVVQESKTNIRNLWKPLIGIAASLVLIVTLTISLQNNSQAHDLANVSPEMATTQEFFKTTLTSELEKLKIEEVESPEFQQMIVDALFQIEVLEQDYQKLKTDLENSGNDKRVIHAMIANYQSRVQILQDVLTNIEELKQQNEISNENNTTL